MRQHLDTVAWLHIGLGILGLLLALLSGAILSFIGSTNTDPEVGRVLLPLAAFIAGFFIVLSVPQIVGGWALLRRKSWARPMVLILSFFSLFNFPLGTAIGGYSIWALMSDEARALFAGPDPRRELPYQ